MCKLQDIVIQWYLPDLEVDTQVSYDHRIFPWQLPDECWCVISTKVQHFNEEIIVKYIDLFLIILV